MSSISIIGLGKTWPAPWPTGRSQAATQFEIIGRDPGQSQGIGRRARRRHRRGGPAPAPAGDIVILAVPYASAAAVVSQYGDALQGKVIVDITNPRHFRISRALSPQRGVLARRRSPRPPPAGAHVVKAFNTPVRQRF